MSAINLAGKIEHFIEIGFNSTTQNDYDMWRQRVRQFLVQAFNSGIAREFYEIQNARWQERRECQIGMLEGLVQKVLLQNPGPPSSTSLPIIGPSNKVLVVHGHDDDAKESVARFIGSLGLEPIILHQQPNAGLTVIEKFEVFADVGLAVILLTPDDVGAARNEELKARARQNVVFELGYFVGRLTRTRVCALYKPGVEIPSDFQGALYVEFDDSGAWHAKLTKELSEARMPINPEDLLKS